MKARLAGWCSTWGPHAICWATAHRPWGYYVSGIYRHGPCITRCSRCNIILKESES